jgi:hypothetical protein
MMPAMVTKSALLGSEERQYVHMGGSLSTSYHRSPYEVYSYISSFSQRPWERVYQYGSNPPWSPRGCHHQRISSGSLQ